MIETGEATIWLENYYHDMVDSLFPPQQGWFWMQFYLRDEGVRVVAGYDLLPELNHLTGFDDNRVFSEAINSESRRLRCLFHKKNHDEPDDLKQPLRVLIEENGGLTPVFRLEPEDL